MSRPFFGLLLFALLVVPGCMGPAAPASSDDAPAAAAPAAVGVTAVSRSLKPIDPSSYDRGDWFTFMGKAAPGGVLNAFEWVVPEGSYVRDGRNPELQSIWLEVAPIRPDNESDPLTAWGLLAFRKIDGESRLSYARYFGTGSFVSSFGVGSANEIRPSTAPFHMRVAYQYPPEYRSNHLKEGETLFIVIAADAAQEEDFGIAFRILDADPYTANTEVPSDLAMFVDARKSQPVAIRRSAHGAGFQFSLYGTYTSQAINSYTIRYGSMSVSDERALPAPVGPQTLTLRSSQDSRSGWSMFNSYAYSYASAGQWGAYGEVRSIPIDVSSTLAMANAVPFGSTATMTAFGFPYLYGNLDGEGASELTFRLEWQRTGAYDSVTFFTVDFGVSLKELLGTSGPQDWFAYTGLLSDVGVVDRPVVEDGNFQTELPHAQ